MPRNLAGLGFSASFAEARMAFPHYGWLFAPTPCNGLLLGKYEKLVKWGRGFKTFPDTFLVHECFLFQQINIFQWWGKNISLGKHLTCFTTVDPTKSIHVFLDTCGRLGSDFSWCGKTCTKASGLHLYDSPRKKLSSSGSLWHISCKSQGFCMARWLVVAMQEPRFPPSREENRVGLHVK